MARQSTDLKNTCAESTERPDTLAAVLKGCEGPVKIGTKDGAGFIYCGLPADLVPQDVDDEMIGEAAGNIQYQDSRLDIIRRNGANLSSYLDKLVKDAQREKKAELPEFSIGDYLKYLDDRIRRMRFHYAQGQALREYVRTYKPIMDRQVADMYESIDADEPDTMIIIVYGSEHGPAWTRSEYESDKFRAARSDKILAGIKYRKEVLGDAADSAGDADPGYSDHRPVLSRRGRGRKPGKRDV